MLNKFVNLLYPKFFPPKMDLGLLVLRGAAFSLFLKHGLEKIFTFSQMAQRFPDPLHIGMVPTLIIATIADAFCAVLVMLGVGTRWAALFMFGNLFVAWAVYRHFWFWIRSNWHGEMTVVYMIALLAIVFTGPGKYSLDSLIQKRLVRETTI